MATNQHTDDESNANTTTMAVETLDGVGPTYAERLADAGINTVGDMLATDVEDLMDAADAPEHRVEAWFDAADELSPDEPETTDTPEPRELRDDTTPAVTPRDDDTDADDTDDTPEPRDVDDDTTPAVTPREDDTDTDDTPAPRELRDDGTPAVVRRESDEDADDAPEPRDVDDDTTPAVTPREDDDTDADDTDTDDTDDTDADAEDDEDDGYDYRTFSLSTIKNYVGGAVAVAVADERDADVNEIIHEHLTSMDTEVRNGAEELGLLDADHQLTDRGRDVVDAYTEQFGDLDGALDHFDEVGKSRGRYVEMFPAVADIVRDVFAQYPLVAVVADVLDGDSLTLDELTRRMWDEDPAYVKDVIVRGTEDVQDGVFANDELGYLDDPHIYRSTTAHKIKTLGYHAGVFTTTGDVPSRLSPTEQTWEIDTRTADDYAAMAEDDDEDDADD